jgi:parallel beta-helix repeat protein
VGLVGCADTTSPPPVTSGSPAALATAGAKYYVSPSGTATGDGSAARPWNLTTALAQPAAVRPGDTIWLRGGTYRGCYRSRLTGTASAPIVVRQYPGERAILDNGTCNDPALTASGAYAWFWGFEVMNSRPTSGGQLGINGFGQELKFINLVVHDASASGVGFWKQAIGGEVYGCLIYNNGRTSNLDHGIYAQNASGTKRIVDNVVFNQMAYGLHIYGSDAASLRNFTIQGNILFNNGSISPSGAAPNLLVGGGSPASGIVVKDNLAYQWKNSTGNFWLGYEAQNEDVVMTGNYIAGGFTALRLWRWRSGTVSNNTLFTRDYYPIHSMGSLAGLAWAGNHWARDPKLAAWLHESTARTWDSWRQATGRGGSDVIEPAPTGVKVVVRPNRYEPGRAYVVIYNWAKQGSVGVDLSGVLKAGDRYTVRNVLRLTGTPVQSGVYSGGKLTVSMAATSAPAPLGSSRTGASTGPEFQAFLVTRE